MDTQNQEINEDQPKPVQKQKRGRGLRISKGRGLIIFLAVLILAVAGASAYYFMERRKPQNTVKSFLHSMQKMDFEGMGTLLQSNDLTALDNADIRNDAYRAFFETINKK